MKDLDAYFAYLESLIRHSGAVEAQIHYVAFASRLGYVRGKVVFADGSLLEFSESLALFSNRVHREAYRYHYMRKGKTVFRYDTAPHHPHLPTHPYHKHDAKGRVLESAPVSLKEVLKEIARYLEDG